MTRDYLVTVPGLGLLVRRGECIAAVRQWARLAFPDVPCRVARLREVGGAVLVRVSKAAEAAAAKGGA